MGIWSRGRATAVIFLQVQPSEKLDEFVRRSQLQFSRCRVLEASEGIAEFLDQVVLFFAHV